MDDQNQTPVQPVVPAVDPMGGAPVVTPTSEPVQAPVVETPAPEVPVAPVVPAEPVEPAPVVDQPVA